MRALAFVVLVGCAHAPIPDGRLELARARTAIAKGDVPRGIRLYERVPRFSRAWPTALFEESREAAHRNAFSQALGLLLTLRAPQLADWVFPEAYAVEADIYVRNCYFQRAVAIAKQFRADVLPLRDRVMDLLGGAPNAHDVPWIESRLADARTDDERWDRLDQLLVELDLADAALEEIEASVTTEALAGDPSNPLKIMVVDEEHDEWQFDGEFWPDELGNYRIPLRSSCRVRGKTLL